jgi:type II secretory pathway component HofQ
MGASRPAALRLWVTPDVNSARHVALTLALEMDVLADRDTPRGVQSVEVQRGVTRPPLDDGETLVISGVVVQGPFGRDRASRLRWMPLLNWIFWPAESEDPTGELLIFLTTRIADR